MRNSQTTHLTCTQSLTTLQKGMNTELKIKQKLDKKDARAISGRRNHVDTTQHVSQYNVLRNREKCNMAGEIGLTVLL
jgi:hypothetical protein